MVTVFLRGGMGNQMFQYAAGLSLAKKNQTSLVLDTVFLRDRFPRRNFAYRTYDLDVFSLAPALTPLSRAANAVPLPGIWLGLDLAGIKAREIVGGVRLIREKSDDFDPGILEERGNLVLFGRWQSEKYFKDVADEVRQAFRFRYPLEGEAKALAQEIAAPNSVSLHVRRGDYAAFANVKALMGETDLGYYSRAAEYIAARVKDPHFFIFSDGIEWCKENIKLPFATTFVDDASRGPKGAFHVELMSRCAHNIIAASTFSWWAAWLNQNPQNMIIAPRRWYASGTMSAKDLVPEAWIRL